jgi:hypothetical protein
MTLSTQAKYTLWWYDDKGMPQGIIDDHSGLKYQRSQNAYGLLDVFMPLQRYEASSFGLDHRFTVTRKIPGKLVQIDTDTVYFHRDPMYMIKGGKEVVRMRAYDANYLLAGRTVDYAAGSAQADKTDPIDDMMKEIVLENFGSSAPAARDISDLLAIQSSTADGPSLTKAFARKNVLQLFQKLSLASIEAGTPVYFDVVASSATDLEFQTFINQRGTDRTATSRNPIQLFHGENFIDATYSIARGKEATVCQVGGRGEGSARTTVEVENTDRLGESALNRREIFVDSRQDSDSDRLTATGQAALHKRRPDKRLTGQLVNSPGFKYGEDWGFGDKLTVTVFGITLDVRVSDVTVEVTGRGEESITAGFEEVV